jgi:predicted small lipoprotein YifL
MAQARLVALALSALLVACGAKTGLRLPDVGSAPDAPDAADVADVLDAADLPDVCLPRVQPAERFAAEVLFVIDRSRSMEEITSTGVSRWRALTTALERVLPAVDAELWTGLVLFPSNSTVSACFTSTNVDLTPRAFNANNVITSLRRVTPNGGTPTFDALSAASRYYANVPPVGRVRGRYLVLATDGGPNCNAGASVSDCICTNPATGACRGDNGHLSCLDAERTVAALEGLNSRGFSTFVIGVPSSDIPAHEPTLRRMAVAGGRPRVTPAGETYYPAENVTEFTDAFRSITTSLVRCRYVTNPVRDPSEARVRVSGQIVARDETHTEGWDWARTDAGEFVFYGAACEASQRLGATISIELGCTE